jgi:hypothetical protein
MSFVSLLPPGDDCINQMLGGLLRGEELPPEVDLRMPPNKRQPLKAQTIYALPQ